MEPEVRHEIETLTPELARLRIGFVNVYFLGAPGGRWVLVDTGLAIGAARILEVAADRYGRDARPEAILLTHGHFDHIGALPALLGVWDVPVFAHPLELPFLTGRADYPPPDPTVGGGLMARLAPLFPQEGIDLGAGRARALPANGTLPVLPGWRWIHTPGHAPGHVSFFQEATGALVAGDAVVTTNQASVYAVLTQHEELHGPPAYFTIDWGAAHRSVEAIASLEPTLLATGHGVPMRGDHVAAALAELARDFDHRARPRRGRYVEHPAVTDEHGVVALPPPVHPAGVRWGVLTGVAATAVAGTWLVRRFARRST